MQFVQGPDFPTGGLIMGTGGIMDAYRTGRGSIRMRAVAEIEESTKGGDRSSSPSCRTRSGPNSVLTKIKELVDAPRSSRASSDANEESAGDDTRIVITLKRDAPALIILNNLYKRTPLQTSFAVNTVALVDGVPRTLNLQRRACRTTSTTRSRSSPGGPSTGCDKARERAHIVEGLLKALDMIDEIIADHPGVRRQGRGPRRAAWRRRSSSPRSRPSTSSTCSSHRLTRLGRANLEEEMARAPGDASPSSRRSSATGPC